MKKYYKIATTFIIVLAATIILTGCESKREELSFKGDEGSLTFNVKKDTGCKLTTDKKNFRTSREQGTLICKDFKIGIEFDDDFDYFFNGDFNSLKAARKNNDEYKEITYSNAKGIQYFYGGYMRYNIILKIKDSKKYYLVLTVYGNENNAKSAQAAIKNEETLDVLNNITNIKAVK